MATQNPTAVTYSGQFSNQTLPIIAFAAALRALHKKMGIVRWTKNKNFAGSNVGPGAQVPIPYVGRIGNGDVTPGVTPPATTALPNQTRYLLLDSWKKTDDFALTGQELSIFQMSSIVPRALERSVQSLAETFENSAAGLAYAFPAVYGTPNVSAFASNANAIRQLRGEMSKGLCPNGDDVALFLRSTDVTDLTVTDDFKKNPQLAGLDRAEKQYGKAMLAEILSMTIFENQFISTRTPGTYAGATMTLGAAGAIAATSLTVSVTGANVAMKKGDSLKIASSTAPEGYTFVSVAADVSIANAGSGTVTITQPLEFACANGAAVTSQTTAAAGYSPYENLAITPDALAIGNRVLQVGDLAERLGTAWSVTDDDSAENDYLGTGLTFTLKSFPGSFQEMWNASIFYGMTWADTRLGGRLLTGGVAI